MGRSRALWPGVWVLQVSAEADVLGEYEADRVERRATRALGGLPGVGIPFLPPAPGDGAGVVVVVGCFSELEHIQPRPFVCSIWISCVTYCQIWHQVLRPFLIHAHSSLIVNLPPSS